MHKNELTAEPTVSRLRVVKAMPENIAAWVFPEFQEEMRGSPHFELLQEIDSPQWESTTNPTAGHFLRVLADLGIINLCLNLEEGMLFASQGTLDQRFKGRHILLWRSAGYDPDGNCLVPFIQNIVGQPFYVQPWICWYWLQYPLYKRQVTLLWKLRP